MEQNDIDRMWRIDTDIQMGEELTNEEIIFYNKNRKLMITNLQEELDHWKYHTEDCLTK